MRGRVAVTNCWISRRVIEGSMRASPAATHAHGRDELFARGVFEQEAAGPGAQGGVDVLVGVEGSEHQDPALGLGEDDPSGRQPVHVGHADVHEHDGGGETAGEPDGFEPVARLAYHGDVRLVAQDHPETGPDEALVVGYKDRDLLGGYPNGAARGGTGGRLAVRVAGEAGDDVPSAVRGRAGAERPAHLGDALPHAGQAVAPAGALRGPSAGNGPAWLTTRTSTVPAWPTTAMSIGAPGACFIALVTASWTTR